MKTKYLYFLKSFGIFTLMLLGYTVFAAEHFVSHKLINTEYNNELSKFETSIQKAIDMAFDGDTIRVAEGTYDQDLLTINKSIILLGCQVGNSPKNKLIRDGGECCIVNSINTYTSLVINAKNVVIDGFKFGNELHNVFNSVYINAPNAIVRNCIIVNTNSCGIYVSANGINSQVAYNHIDHSALEGIFNLANGVNLLSNYISNVQEFSAITTTTKTIIKGNIISNIPENGINLYQPEALLSLIYGNEISNAGIDVLYCEENTTNDSESDLANSSVESFSTQFSINNEFIKKSDKSLVILESAKNPKDFLDDLKIADSGISSFSISANTEQKSKQSKSIFKF